MLPEPKRRLGDLQLKLFRGFVAEVTAKTLQNMETVSTFYICKKQTNKQSSPIEALTLRSVMSYTLFVLVDILYCCVGIYKMNRVKSDTLS